MAFPEKYFVKKSLTLAHTILQNVKCHADTIRQDRGHATTKIFVHNWHNNPNLHPFPAELQEK